MAEYIDKTKLIADGWFLNRTYQQDAHTMIYESKKIADIPSADVAPVRHERWIIHSDGDIGLLLECSGCNAYADAEFLFCPNCGADMRRG